MAKERSGSTTDDEGRKRPQKGGKVNGELDDALEGTFPASDPVTVGDVSGDEPARAPKDRQTPEIDKALVDKLARELKEEAGKD